MQSEASRGSGVQRGSQHGQSEAVKPSGVVAGGTPVLRESPMSHLCSMAPGDGRGAHQLTCGSQVEP